MQSSNGFRNSIIIFHDKTLWAPDKSEKTKGAPSRNALTGIAREGDGQPVRAADP